jgi:TldD protein
MNPTIIDSGTLEARRHELRKMRMSMVGGKLISNLRTVERGVSARAYRGGYWGFASAPAVGSAADEAAALARVRQQALANAAAMGRFGSREDLALPGQAYRGQHRFEGRTALSAAECGARLAELHDWVQQKYPGLRSIHFLLGEEQHHKDLSTDAGGESLASIQRGVFAMTLVGEDIEGAPIEVDEVLSSLGSLADLDWSLATVAPLVDRLHEHLQAKRHAVAARGGLQTVVMAPELAGMLAHEAMGHPCEADAVLAGAVTADLVGKPVASALVSMVDFAHHYQGAEAMCPVYVDDEGVAARDVVMIERGLLKDFMHSRETAARLGQAPTGNARAYNPHDEPLVRMRNTAILPGPSTLASMIEGVDDGYLLVKTGNGQADTTTEFMFGVTLGYEIKGGKLGRAIRDTTVSGSAIKVLQSVDAVGDDMVWNCAGYCGKKQPMVVSVGGPSLRARAHLGGE